MFDISNYFDAIVQWVTVNPNLTGFFIFLIAFTESLVVIGILMPGAAMMIAVGVLIGMGKLSFWPAVTWAIAGAVAGDGLSYWLGHHYKNQLRNIWPFKNSTSLIQRGERFFEKHGGKSVVLGRFVGPIRAIIPTIAGMMGMTPLRFTFVNVLSAIAWAPAFFLPGIVVGTLTEAASESAMRLVWMFFLIIVLLLLAHWLTRKLFSFFQARTETMVLKILNWGQRHKWVTRYTQSLLEPDTQAYRALIISTSVLLLASLTLLALVTLGLPINPETHVNSTVNQFFRTLRTPGGDQVMTFITMFADPFVYMSLIVVTVIWCGITRHIQAIYHFLFAVGLTAAIVAMFKYGINLPRPDNSLANLTNLRSFPSAHSAMGLSVYGFIAILIANGMRYNLRSIPYVTATLLVISIAFSRLYLGAHWLNDIAGAILIALICLSVTGISYQRHIKHQYASHTLSVLVVLTLITSITVHLNLNFKRELKRYTPVTQTLTFDPKQWFDQGWRKRAAFRFDLRGHKDQPISLQYFGNLETLKAALIKNGWQASAKFKVSSLVHWIEKTPSLKRLPVLPQVNNGHHEKLLLVKQVNQQRFVIRFWRSNFVAANGTRLYLGNTARLDLHQRFGVFSYPVTSNDFQTPLDFLEKHLSEFQVKTVTRNVKSTNADIKWNQTVLLIRSK